MNQHHPSPASHFNKKTLKALGKRGIWIYSSTWLPDSNGSYLNGETGYLINDNETSRLLSYLEVLDLAK